MLATRAPLGKQKAGDQEAAQYEEGVDAEEPAPSPRQPGMIGQYGGNRQRPHAVQRRLVGETALDGALGYALPRNQKAAQPDHIRAR